MPNSPVLDSRRDALDNGRFDQYFNGTIQSFCWRYVAIRPAYNRFCNPKFFYRTGAVIASVLPYVLTNWFHIQNTAPAGQIPLSVKLSFYIGGVVFISAVIWTIIKTKEYSPEELS